MGTHLGMNRILEPGLPHQHRNRIVGHHLLGILHHCDRGRIERHADAAVGRLFCNIRVHDPGKPGLKVFIGVVKRVDRAGKAVFAGCGGVRAGRGYQCP